MGTSLLRVSEYLLSILITRFIIDSKSHSRPVFYCILESYKRTTPKSPIIELLKRTYSIDPK